MCARAASGGGGVCVCEKAKRHQSAIMKSLSERGIDPSINSYVPKMLSRTC